MSNTQSQTSRSDHRKHATAHKRISAPFIDRLKSTTDLVDLVEKTTGRVLKKSGSSHVTNCCFHEEKTPSFHVWETSYHCFGGCGASGDAVEFLMQYHSLEFREAVAELAAFNGMQLPEELTSEINEFPTSLIRSIFKDATDFYVDGFHRNGEALEYMYETRGFENLDFLRDQKIGASSPDQSLLSHLRQKYSLDALVKSGLIGCSDKGHYFDFYGNHLGSRIIIPIRDQRGNTIAFTGRVFLEADELRVKQGEIGKYINTKEVPFFSKKSQWLDGIDKLPKKPDNIVVVEGNIDRLSAVYRGYPAVALGSAHLSVEQIQKLMLHARYGKSKIFLCFDGDNAGDAGVFDSIKLIFNQLHLGGRFYVVSLPRSDNQKTDPDTYLRTHSKHEFDDLLDASPSLTDYFLSSIQKSVGWNATDPQASLAVLKQAKAHLESAHETTANILASFIEQAICPPPPPKKPEVTDPQWAEKLISNKEKCIYPNEFNLKLIFENDEAWRGAIGFNTFNKKVCKLSQLPIDQHEDQDEKWDDTDDFNAVAWVNNEYRFNPKRDMVTRAIVVAAQGNPFNPLKDYLRSLKWDGMPRIDTWLKDYLCSDQDDEYLKLVGGIWLISAVARGLQPGCKVDTVPILEGAQGTGKTSVIKRLCPNTEWHIETQFNIGHKDVYEVIQGKWLVELAELKSLMGVDAETSKAFFSSDRDTFIPKYQRHSVSYRRQCVFIGTGNLDEYLRDATGNRRYLPIRCNNRVDLDKLGNARDQLWAEAVYRYDNGEKWYTEADNPLVLHEHQSRMETDPWDSAIERFTEAHESFTIEQILTEVLQIAKQLQHRGHQTRIGRILTRLGYQSKQQRNGVVRERLYVKK